ncbi:glycerophosphoryl diester phosphodiesterase [Rhodoferax sp.]|uniref:glycerophosphoryl diester phosphodiesterase n=1 Tax=Rhodoferax sp. TaxID=50421 RepID=UPI0025EDC206|nr:glycerophosphoryl diester phosphodiesterase [Rhodoferax sp.]
MHTSAEPAALPVWPYPRWVAHRGAGKLAPENTLAAFREGAAHGYRMFECDVKLSADGVPFLLHDATLARTTDASNKTLAQVEYAPGTTKSIANNPGEIAGNHPWSTLSQLDAGSWHSRRFAGEPVPTLDAIARYCIRNGYFLNIEIKPTPGTERHTGEVVAHHAARLWAGQAVPPLLTSFEPEALEGALAKQPDLPRGLLLDTLWSGWLETALRLGCRAIVCNHQLWDAGTVVQAKAAGLRTLSYTVNEEPAAQRLLALETDGIITDRVDLFSPS